MVEDEGEEQCVKTDVVSVKSMKLTLWANRWTKSFTNLSVYAPYRPKSTLQKAKGLDEPFRSGDENEILQ